MFIYLLPKPFVPKDHPMRPNRTMVDSALAELDAGFNALYSPYWSTFDPSRAVALGLAASSAFLRSKQSHAGGADQRQHPVSMVCPSGPGRQGMGSLLLLDQLGAHDRRRYLPTVSDQNRSQARKARLLSNEHFSVDGTLIEAWSSIKGFCSKDGVPSRRWAAIRSAISTARSSATEPMSPPMISRLGSTRKARGSNPE